MSLDDQKIRSEVRRALETIGDAAVPPRPFEEIGVPPPGSESDGSTRPQRALAVAGSLAVLSALVVGLVVVRWDRDDTSPAGVDVPVTTWLGTATSTEPTGSSPPVAPPSTAPSDLAVPAVEPTTAAPSTSVPPDSGPTLEEVRQAQVDALRRLPGFAATVVRTVFTPGTGEAESEQTARITLLPDGSFYADRGADGWGSYDPATHITRGVFPQPDGTTGYQEIVGQTDRSIPLGVIAGYDPVMLVMADTATVAETSFEGRDVWEVTTLFEMGPSMCEGGCDTEPATQTTIDTIDQATGLVIRRSVTSTAANTVPSLSVLRDVEIVDRMPAGFPGVFPDGVTVDRSGDPDAVATTSFTNIPSHFGVPVPLPAGFARSTISYRENDGMWMDEAGEQITTFHRTVEFSVPDGFTTTRVMISAMSVPPGGVIPPGMIAVEGGFVCTSADGDDQCDSLDATTVSSRRTDGTVTLTSGALAGLEAFQDEGSTSTTSGPFQITILAGDRDAALAIANDFVLVNP